MVVFQKLSQLAGDLKTNLQSALPIFVLILYTLFGAIIFMTIEGPNEEYELIQLKKKRHDLLEDTIFKLNGIRGMSPVEAYNHTLKTLIRYRNRLEIGEVDVEADRKWNIWGSLFYSLTVYTTIGYGNIVPETVPGRILTIIYAFIGIPLAIISLVALGGLFAKLCRFVWRCMLRGCSCFSKRLEKKVSELGPDQQAPAQADADEDDLLSFPISFLVVLTVLWIIICAAIFTTFEDWDFWTSLYFTLISFTTIGFGDVLPSEPDYMIFIGILLLVGLALVSTMLNLIQQQIEALAGGMENNIDQEYAQALAEADAEGALVNADQAEAAPAGTGVDAEQGKKKEVDPRSMDAVVSRMPAKSRMMYHMMPASSKKRLQDHAAAKSRLRVASTQTEPHLLTASVSSSMDDVTLLVASDEHEHLARLRHVSPHIAQPENPVLLDY